MFSLAQLPYDYKALEPYISGKTMELHHDKHHQTYLDNLNKLITGTELENESLENIIIKSAGQADKIAIFNNAAQVFNHDFFWKALRPAGDDPFFGLSEELKNSIEKNFSSLENFLLEFKTAGLAQFGSGWVWLVKDGDDLKIVKTTNADNPLTSNLKPLLSIDVWEHSYYLDYQNKRADYLETVLKNLLNWSEASKLFSK